MGPQVGTLMPRLGEESASCRKRLTLTPASTASWQVNGARASGSGSGRGVFTGPSSQNKDLPQGLSTGTYAANPTDWQLLSF
jgi:hypothetical protein